MKHIFSLIVTGCLFGLVCFYSVQLFSYDVPEAAAVAVTTPQFTVDASSKPKLSAPAYAIFDIETGQVLLEQNSGEIHPIASVTKLFTATAILESAVP